MWINAQSLLQRFRVHSEPSGYPEPYDQKVLAEGLGEDESVGNFSVGVFDAHVRVLRSVLPVLGIGQRVVLQVSDDPVEPFPIFGVVGRGLPILNPKLMTEAFKGCAGVKNLSL